MTKGYYMSYSTVSGQCPDIGQESDIPSESFVQSFAYIVEGRILIVGFSYNINLFASL